MQGARFSSLVEKTRSCMPQGSPKILWATTKAWCSQKKKESSFLPTWYVRNCILFPFAFKIVSEMEHSYIFISHLCFLWVTYVYSSPVLSHWIIVFSLLLYKGCLFKIRKTSILSYILWVLFSYFIHWFCLWSFFF